MDQDLEEGELLDSENEEDGSKAASAPFGRETLPRQADSSSCAVFNQLPRASTACRNPVQKLQIDSCDSASSDAESDYDSDDAPLPKKKCSSLTRTAVIPPAIARPTTKYNIWGSVLQEQTLAKDLGGWFGMNTKVESDRDVETYDYRNAKNDKTGIEDNDNVDIDTVIDSEEPVPNGEDANICDRETFGTSVSTSSADVNQPEDRKPSYKRKRDGTVSGCNRKCVQSRLSKRTYNREKLRSHIRVSVDDSVTAVAEELVRVLGEPVHMMQTFVRVVETLGVEKALELMYCTEDLEEAGGLMIKNGSRRRTPGGVYLFLLRDDSCVTREQQDIIFYGSTEERKRQQRETKRRRWRHHHDVIAATQSNSSDRNLRPLPDCKDLFLNGGRSSNGKIDSSLQLDSNDACDVDDNATAVRNGKLCDYDDVDDDAVHIELDLA